MRENILRRLLINSVLEVNKMKILGSSTVCVIYIDKNRKTLFSANIGDSCYLIARPTKEGFERVYKSEEQQHSFNVPYQVGQSGDRPHTAVINTHKLEINDIIVLATDGLWDNLNVEQVLEILPKYNEDKDTSTINTQKFSNALAEEAERLSMNQEYMSPFALNAKKLNRRYVGGKPDDVSVIVSQILDKNLSDENTSVGSDDHFHDTSVDNIIN